MDEMVNHNPAELPPVAAVDSIALVAGELTLPQRSVAAVVQLLSEGSTVPFIARYRKEVTGSLDEVQIRAIQERHAYLVELAERRQTIISSISEQGKLTAALEARLYACTTKAALEDLYLPYKPKRRTRATVARERGLAPLAELILAQPLSGDPLAAAAAYVDSAKGVEDAAAALAGARDIVAEQIAENADIRAVTRAVFAQQAILVATPVPEKSQEPTKFEQYYNYREAVAAMPSHRYLAVRRGEREGVLRVHLEVDPAWVVPTIRQRYALNPSSPFAEQLELAAADSFVRLLAPSVETDVRVELKQRSDHGAVEIFANNLRNLLLAAPLGDKPVIGLDPGLRTGCKCVVLDSTGKFLTNTTLFLTQGETALERAQAELLALVARFSPFAIAIGNGTASRETEQFVRQALAAAQVKEVVVVQVNESGASVYSASETAREEFPQLDVTVRGAISIGRRLQDPLAELVKIDPKSIGVGQYQHDVHQPLLQRKLDEVVESCVNHVGVELNTASAPLLARVSGIGPALAKRIVTHREEHGAFSNRQALLDISGLGPRTFEQAAGFLRVRGSDHPLDASAVHPERYALVERMAQDLHVELKDLVGNTSLATRIDIGRYATDTVGEPTLRDIVQELQKPGRDPRASFEAPKFRDDVFAIEQLKVGMEFVGAVTNVTAFGAFVDIGVHQDGLVHISQLADKFVKDPHAVVAVGDKLKVRVLEVDVTRRRISLSARSPEGTRPTAGSEKKEAPSGQVGGKSRGERAPKGGSSTSKFANNPFANLRLTR